MSTTRYYHFYEIPKGDARARRRNIAPVRSASEARKVRDYYNSMGLPTAVYVNQQDTSPCPLPVGETLWR